MDKQLTGTVTFLFTDIEGSTKLWEQHPEAMPKALAQHDELLRQIIATHNGYVFKTMGDAFCAAFATAAGALKAALRIQSVLHAEDLGETPIKDRLALHTGTADEREGDYFGPPVNRVARLLSAGHGGQILLSSAAQELVRDQLPEQVTLRDLGEHRLKDLTRPERIFQVVVPDLPADFPPLKTLDMRPHNLPAQTTSFIGREVEVATVVQELARADVRLLTLTGPGGTGKTRLSLQVAAEVLDAYPDGVWFVALAPISDPTFVVPTISQTLELQLSGATPPLELVKTYLKEKHLLLVLDNFEQVVEAAPAITEILAAAPQVKILVTSRTVLRVSGEHNYPVPSMHLPDPQQPLPLTRLTQYEAVRLFIERAQAAKPDFSVTNTNAPAVAEICVRLDGLPLAIELAAARIRLLPPQTMLPQLAHRLKFLTGGARDVPARQQTLQNTIEWSYQLLTPEEKTLFRRLAVFVGGCTLEAVETVCSISDELDMLSGLESLVDKSLLKQVETDEEPRLVMLETIREYALERLSESDEEGAIRQQHALFFLALAEEAEQEFFGVDPVVWIHRLEREHNNLRAALAWAIDHTLEVGLRLAGALRTFWHVRSYQREGRKWVENALAKSQHAGHDLDQFRAKALHCLGWLAVFQGDVTTACTAGQDSVALWRTVGDTGGLAQTLLGLGVAMVFQKDFAQASSFIEESITLFRQLDDHCRLAEALGWYGELAYENRDYERAYTSSMEERSLAQHIGSRTHLAAATGNLGRIVFDKGDYVAARNFFEESLRLYREVQDEAGIQGFLSWLGRVLDKQQHYDQAQACYEERLELAQKMENQSWRAEVYTDLGYLALHQQHWQQARTHFTESLTLYSAGDDKMGVLRCLVGLAGVAEGQGHAEQAAQLLGAREAFLETMQVTLPRTSLEPHFAQDRYESIVTAARTALGAEAFTAAITKGRAMTLEQAIALAMEGQQGAIMPDKVSS
jgi:predicted ATPase/class 3 adenylate cyclase